MMSDLGVLCAGRVRGSGTYDPVVVGRTNKNEGIDETLADGQEFTYFRQYVSDKKGFEEGVGIWRANTRTIEQSSIIRTSADNGTDPIYWGDDLQVVTVKKAGIGFSTLTAYPNKPENESFLFVDFGQSNDVGFAVAESTIEYNPRVFTWAPANGELDGDCAWIVADPTAPTQVGFDPLASPSQIVRGYLGGNAGAWWLSAAQDHQKKTGRDVYVFAVSRGGALITEFDPNGDASVWDVLAEEWALAKVALAEIPNTPTTADMFITGLGPGDGTNDMAAGEFAAKMMLFIDRITWPDSSILHKKNTKLFFADIPNPNRLGLRWEASRILNGWGGNNTYLFPYENEDTADIGHITGDAQVRVGQNISQMALAGASQKTQEIGFTPIRPTTFAETSLKYQADSDSAPSLSSFRYNGDSNDPKIYTSIFTTGFTATTQLLGLDYGTTYTYTQASDSNKSVSFRSAGGVTVEAPFGIIIPLTAAPTYGSSGAPDEDAVCNGICDPWPVYDMDYSGDDGVYGSTTARLAMSRLADSSLSFITGLTNQVGVPSTVMQATGALGEFTNSPVIHARFERTTSSDTAANIAVIDLPDDTQWGYIVHQTSALSDYTELYAVSLRGSVSNVGGSTSYGSNATAFGASGSLTAGTATNTGGTLTVKVSGVAAETWSHAVDVYMWPLNI